MKAVGIVRRIDGLGRIVIPTEIRRSLRIYEGDQMEIFLDGKRICFEKYAPCENTKEECAKNILKQHSYLYDTAVITREGKVITAEIINGSRKRRKGIAKCSPQDEFSPYIGELIALARAWNTPEIIPDDFL